MGGIEFLELFRVAAHIGMAYLGQLFVSALDPGRMTVGKELFHLEFEKLHTLSFHFG